MLSPAEVIGAEEKTTCHGQVTLRWPIGHIKSLRTCEIRNVNLKGSFFVYDTLLFLSVLNTLMERMGLPKSKSPATSLASDGSVIFSVNTDATKIQSEIRNFMERKMYFLG